MFGLEDELQNEITILKEIISAQKELITLLKSQIEDLTMMSKIELGDDVISKILELDNIVNPKVELDEETISNIIELDKIINKDV